MVKDGVVVRSGAGQLVCTLGTWAGAVDDWPMASRMRCSGK